LGGTGSLVPDDGAFTVDGGNWRIFSGMIKASGAKLHLSTDVTDIKKRKCEGQSNWRVSTDHGSEIFDGVVLAAPFVLPASDQYLTIDSIRHFV
jgi:protoporphyrinogen oxidase